MTEYNQIIPETSFKRNALFTFMCILSFIGNGIMISIGLGGIFSIRYFSGLLETHVPGKGDLGSEMILWMSIFTLLIFSIKLWSILLMYQGRKAGYLLYLIVTGVLMIANIYLIFATLSIGFIVYLFISVLFVVAYGNYYKIMR